MSNPKQIATAKPAPSPTYDDDTDSDDGLLVFRQLGADVAHSDKAAGAVITPLSSCQERKRRAWRKQYQFWLQDDKPLQCTLGWWIEDLKANRTFAPVIRKALLLYRELIAGETAMLYQLFPEIAPKPLPPMPSPEIENMKKKIENLEGQVELLKGILIKQSSPGAVDMEVKMSAVGHGLQKAAPPLMDDSDNDTPLVIRKDMNAGGQAALNFIKSAFALQGAPPPVTTAPVVSEVDTSSSFLDMF